MTNLNKKVEQAIRDDFPEFEVIPKHESWHQRLIGFLMFWMWDLRTRTSRYMTRYTSTIGGKVYAPADAIDRGTFWVILAHEYVHLVDAREKPFFKTAYLFPQILSVLSLVAIATPWWGPAKFFVIALVFLLPLPAPLRKHFELRGYAMNIACTYWKTGIISAEQVEWAVGHFTGPNYFFMWPFKESIRKDFMKVVESIRTGEILNDPTYSKIHRIVSGG